MDLGSRDARLSIPIPSSYPSLHESPRPRRHPRGYKGISGAVEEPIGCVVDPRSEAQGRRAAEIRTVEETMKLQEAPNGDDYARCAGDAASKKTVHYRECRKNHAASIGGYAVDGCGEFMPSGEEGTAAAMKCAACNCHRNFHRREIETEALCDCPRVRR